MTKAQILAVLEETKENLEKQTLALKESQKQNKRLAASLSKLKKVGEKAKEMNTDSEIEVSESRIDISEKNSRIATFKHSFRIDFYDEGEGLLRGKIEHLLTKKKKAFKGLDTDTVSTFIQSNIEIRKPATDSKIQAEKSKLKDIAHSQVLDTEPAGQNPQLKTFKIIALGSKKNKPTQIIDHKLDYQAQLQLGDSELIESENIAIYAKSMLGGRRFFLGKSAISTTGKSDKICVNIHTTSLSPGTYRLTAALDLPSTKKETEQVYNTDLSEGRLIEVY